MLRHSHAPMLAPRYPCACADAVSNFQNTHAADEVPEISDDCREEVYQYKISRNKNINKNIPLGG